MGQSVTLEYIQRLRVGMGRVVLTNGCFDVLTPAHFDLIKFAAGQKKPDGVLVVAVNSDEAVRALKGPNRPINGERDRATALSQICGVDYVVIFGNKENPSVEPVVEAIGPDVLVKGGNYRVSEVVGRVFVERHGGRVVMSPHRPGVSTTATIAACEKGQKGQKREEGKPLPSSVLRRPPSAVRPPSSQRDWLALVDMDGTLIDFPGEIIRRLCPDKSYADFQGQYDIGKALGLPTDLYSMVGPDFWASCPWMADGEAIWQTILEAVGPERVLLCSSPTHETSSPMGKLRWIEHHLGDEWLRRYIFTPCKWACAGPGTVLIDDCDEVFAVFQAAGGAGILVPRPWNAGWRAARRLLWGPGYVADSLSLILGERNVRTCEGCEGAGDA